MCVSVMRTGAALLSLWIWVNTGIDAAQTGEWQGGYQTEEGHFSCFAWILHSLLSRHWRDVYPVRQLQSVGLLRCGARWFSLWGWSEAPRPPTDHIHGWSVLVPSPSNTISSCCFVVQTVAVVFCACSALMASLLRITTSSIYHHAVICYFLFTTDEALWWTSY